MIRGGRTLVLYPRRAGKSTAFEYWKQKARRWATIDLVTVALAAFLAGYVIGSFFRGGLIP